MILKSLNKRYKKFDLESLILNRTKESALSAKSAGENKKSIKSRLIILSDLFGDCHSDWENFYINFLKSHYDVQYYDCCELGQTHQNSFAILGWYFGLAFLILG